MSYSPLVSVIMPVFNAEKFLRESIPSILAQTYKNFEFIILDDGSTDSSVSISSHYAARDSRIKLHISKTNLGITRILNKGVAIAKGTYIARMDADDISFSTRLEKQVEFLHNHPEHILVGTSVELFFGNQKPSGIQPLLYSSHAELKINSLFYCPFFHPSIMVKADIIKTAPYDENYPRAEDYELWTRLLRKNPCANLNEVLLYYRMHPQQKTQTETNTLLSFVSRLHQKQFDYYRIKYNSEDLEIHQFIPGSNTTPLSLEQLQLLDKWLKKLYLQLLENNDFDNKYLDVIFQNTWKNICKKGKQNGLKTFFLFKKGFFYKKDNKSTFLFYFISHHYFKAFHFVYLKAIGKR